MIRCKIGFFALVSIWTACGPRTGVQDSPELAPKPDTTSMEVRKARQWIAASERGVKLYKMHCAVCHNRQHSCIGDGRNFSAGLLDRLPSPAELWFSAFVLNSDSVIASGDAYALKIKAENGGASMPLFKGILNQNQVWDIYCFVATPKELLLREPLK